MRLKINSGMWALIKAVKGICGVIKQWIKAVDDLFFTVVSRVRQAIEARFYWLIDKAYVQRASKVRYTSELKIHDFGRLPSVFLNYAY